MKLLQLADQVRYPTMSTAELRSTFLIDDLFQPDQINLTYIDADRTIVGSAMPVSSVLTLLCPDELRATHFTERRELGVFNIGGPGSVHIDGHLHPLGRLDALYIGQGAHNISFSSSDAVLPAEFYLLTYPAHAVYPIATVRAAEAGSTAIGSPATANSRKITRLIHLEGIRSCQLVMGFTELAAGSVWNTMPPHTHTRRSEVYLYFDLAPEARVMHLMGPPEETRHIVIANKQAVVSPGWSIHAGVGTSNYSFCWGMGGENQVYTDMDALTIADLR